MAEKVKLDVIENFPEIDLTDIAIPDDPEMQLPVNTEKWALNKLLVISLPVVIVVLIIIGLSWFYFTRTTNITAKRSQKKIAAPLKLTDKKFEDTDVENVLTAGPQEEADINFKDFLIDLKDKSGKSRILQCDFVLVVNAAENIAGLENREDIRNLIFQTTTGKSAVALRSIEERNNLKNELLQELNKMLGAGFIKKIYITNYVIM
jgi:flagellar basal body-associated protein FliL